MYKTYNVRVARMINVSLQLAAFVVVVVYITTNNTTTTTPNTTTTIHPNVSTTPPNKVGVLCRDNVTRCYNGTCMPVVTSTDTTIVTQHPSEGGVSGLWICICDDGWKGDSCDTIESGWSIPFQVYVFMGACGIIFLGIGGTLYFMYRSKEHMIERIRMTSSNRDKVSQYQKMYKSGVDDEDDDFPLFGPLRKYMLEKELSRIQTAGEQGPTTSQPTPCGSRTSHRTPRGSISSHLISRGSKTGRLTPRGSRTGHLTPHGSITGHLTPHGSITGRQLNPHSPSASHMNTHELSVLITSSLSFRYPLQQKSVTETKMGNECNSEARETETHEKTLTNVVESCEIDEISSNGESCQIHQRKMSHCDTCQKITNNGESSFTHERLISFDELNSPQIKMSNGELCETRERIMSGELCQTPERRISLGQSDQTKSSSDRSAILNKVSRLVSRRLTDTGKMDIGLPKIAEDASLTFGGDLAGYNSIALLPHAKCKFLPDKYALALVSTEGELTDEKLRELREILSLKRQRKSPSERSTSPRSSSTEIRRTKVFNKKKQTTQDTTARGMPKYNMKGNQNSQSKTGKSKSEGTAITEKESTSVCSTSKTLMVDSTASTMFKSATSLDKTMSKQDTSGGVNNTRKKSQMSVSLVEKPNTRFKTTQNSQKKKKTRKLKSETTTKNGKAGSSKSSLNKTLHTPIMDSISSLTKSTTSVFVARNQDVPNKHSSHEDDDDDLINETIQRSLS